MEPSHGNSLGSTPVTIRGANFQSQGEVMFISSAGTDLGPCRWAGVPNMTYSLELIRCV